MVKHQTRNTKSSKIFGFDWWELLEKNSDLFRFVKHCIAFRRTHPVLRNHRHFQNQDYVGSGYADITWHGTQAWQTDWSNHVRTIAFMLCGKHALQGTTEDNYIYVAINMHWESHYFEIPGLPLDMQWHVFANTSCSSPHDCHQPGHEPILTNQSAFLLGDRSVVILIGK